MLDALPGFIAEDVAALLRDLPLPAAGDIPGMNVDKAHNIVYTMLCNILCNIHDT
jgi:hypothetical protein